MTNSPFTKLPALTEDAPQMVKQFMKLVTEDCKEPDCDEVLSPCCRSEMSTVFGSLPLEVSCKSCKKTYLLRDLLKNL